MKLVRSELRIARSIEIGDTGLIHCSTIEVGLGIMIPVVTHSLLISERIDPQFDTKTGENQGSGYFQNMHNV